MPFLCQTSCWTMAPVLIKLASWCNNGPLKMDQAKASLYRLVSLFRKKVFIQRQNVLLPSDHQPVRPLEKWNIWDYHRWQQPSEEKSDNNTVHLFMLRQLTNQSMIPELSHSAASQTCLKTPPLFPLPQLLTWLASLQGGLEIISRPAPVKPIFARTQPVFGRTYVFHLGLSDCTLQ